MRNQDIIAAAKKHGVPISWVQEALVVPKVRDKGVSFARYYAVAMQNHTSYDPELWMQQAQQYLDDYLGHNAKSVAPFPRVPPSCDRLVWIDYRVFWVDMKYKAVRNADGCIIQSALKDVPQDMWVEGIELTYDGANFKDHHAIYDRMFDNHQNHRAVKYAVLCADAAIAKARAA